MGAGGSASAADVYDYEQAPILLGGGGDSGGNLATAGGNGGGSLDLIVTGTLTFGANGKVTANGAHGTSPGASGAGGAVRLRVATLAGASSTSRITANGADGANGTAAGGGGRVGIEYRTKTFNGVLQANGGTGSRPGANGTVYQRDLINAPASVPSRVEAAAISLCKLSSGGAVTCSGSDDFGQVSRVAPSIYKHLATGPYATCAVHESGVVTCWGEVETSNLIATPIDPLTTVAVDLTAACGILQGDSSLVCWGTDSDHVLSGKPTTGTYIDVALSDLSACAQRTDGTITCWGTDFQGIVSGAPTSAMRKIDAGSSFFCGLRIDGSIACWGSNANGQCNPPVGTGYTAISAGARHACAITPAGDAVCWGDNDAGQATPTGGGYSQISASDEYTCASTSSGSVTCWGLTP